MRRRALLEPEQHELMDSGRWPRCERFDGETQPCLCWFGRRQQEIAEAGDWPGGDTGVLGDWLALVVAGHDCRQPYDGSDY